MKSNSNDKKSHAKSNHKADKSGRSERGGDRETDEHPERTGNDRAERLERAKSGRSNKGDAAVKVEKGAKPGKGAKVVEVPAGKSGRGARARKGAAEAEPADDQPKTRLALLKARHESMKREIDQIREDLESDEDE